MASSAAWRTTVPASGLPAAIAVRGPGRLGREGASGVMIFDAGQDCRSGDMMARFFSEEIDSLLWLEDYLLDNALLKLREVPEDGPPGLAEDDDEIAYQKSALTTTETDGSWADG